MLGRLLLGGFSSTANVPESTLDEAHTRELLFPSNADSSPELSALLTPFDYTRFELNDTRCVIAQDASASQSACMLFDSKDKKLTAQPVLHRRGTSSVFGRVPPPGVRQSPTTPGPRNRSSTFSSPFIPDADPKDHTYTGQLLECMFGAASTAKGGNSTKMHIINPDSDRILNIGGTKTFRQNTTPLRPSEESGSSSTHDVVLITRTFSVNLPDDVRDNSASTPFDMSPDGYFPTQQKQPKLKSTKSPAFAVAILVRLPLLAPVRPSSRHVGSASSSHSSSWTFLDALPSSLASSKFLADHTDYRIEHLVQSFHIIERSLLALEQVAKVKILDLLKAADNEGLKNVTKTPKEKTMQRTNQRFVQLIQGSLSIDDKIQSVAKQILVRVAHGAKINRVTVGLGLAPGGSFFEELRTILRNYPASFIYTLLTAYLGLIWPDCLGYKKRSKMTSEAQSMELSKSRRVIIVGDHRSTARRLIFLLASFLQGRSESSKISTSAKSATPPKPFMLHSPPSTLSRKGSLRRTALFRMNPEASDTPPLSTSPSSIISSGHNRTIVAQPPLLRKPSTASTPTATPTPATSLAYLTDSYFPATAATQPKDSAASLASLLRRSNSSNAPSPAPTKWGSLLSGFFKADTANTDTAEPEAVRKSSIDMPASRPLSINIGADDGGSIAAKSIITGRPVESGLRTLEDAIDSAISSPQPIPPRLQVDKVDGVVDVDVSGIPGFLSSSIDASFRSTVPLMSPRTPSTHSADGGGSMHSSRSYADALKPKESTDQFNVAGYLKSYHQDFMLQAVSRYPDLQKELKESMTSEPLSKGQLSTSAPATATGASRWHNVSTALLADLKDMSVTRITLKRRLVDINPPTPSASNIGSLSDNTKSSSASRTAPESRITAERLEEAFSSETVQGYDKTLADAIDRALNGDGLGGSRKPSRAGHSRSVSTNSAPTTSMTPQSAPKVITGALQEVVESVDRELHQKDQTDTQENIPQHNPSLKAAGKEENALREGVKIWMECCVENREVW